MKAIRLLAVLFTTITFIYSCGNSGNTSDEVAQKVRSLKKDYFEVASSDLEKSTYKGKVKSVKEIKYNAYSKFGDAEIDTIITQEHIEYNSDGYITYIYNKNNKEHYAHKGIPFEYTYTYEKSDEKSVINCFKGDTLHEKSIKSLNRNNFPTQVDIYNSKGELDKRTKYKYDKRGRLLEKITYNSEGKSIKKLYNITYDVHGFPSQYTDCDISYNENGKTENTSITNLKYDINGNLLFLSVTYDAINTQITRTYKNNKLSTSTFVYHYTSLDYSTKTETRYYENYNEGVTYEHEGDILSRHRTEYEYDAKGNIVKSTVFNNDEPASVTITEFEYYE